MIDLATSRRLYLVIQPSDAGKLALRLTARKPDLSKAMGVMMVPGQLAAGLEATFPVVSDPTQDPELTGPAGKQGDRGAAGWSPVLIPEADGDRRVLRVDWKGGEGAKPDTGYMGLAGTAGALVAKADAFDFNPARVETQRVKVDASGLATVPYVRTFPAGTMPNVQVTVEAPAGATTRYTAQLDGQPGNTSCRVKVLRDGQASLGASLAELLSAKLVVNAPACWVHVSIIPPAVPVTA